MHQLGFGIVPKINDQIQEFDDDSDQNVDHHKEINFNGFEISNPASSK